MEDIQVGPVTVTRECVCKECGSKCERCRRAKNGRRMMEHLRKVQEEKARDITHTRGNVREMWSEQGKAVGPMEEELQSLADRVASGEHWLTRKFWDKLEKYERMGIHAWMMRFSLALTGVAGLAYVSNWLKFW